MALWSLTDSRGLSFYNKKADIVHDVGERLLEGRFVEVKTRKTLAKDKKWLKNRPASEITKDHSLIDIADFDFDQLKKLVEDIEKGEWKDVSKEIVAEAKKSNIERIERRKRELARDLEREQEWLGDQPMSKKELRAAKKAERKLASEAEALGEEVVEGDEEIVEEILQDNEPLAQQKLTKKELRAAKKAEKQALKNREIEELENEIDELEEEIEYVLVSEED